jgi:hypothetical protein
MQSTDEITVTLNAAEWNQVLALLGEGPFRVVDGRRRREAALGQPS